MTTFAEYLRSSKDQFDRLPAEPGDSLLGGPALPARWELVVPAESRRLTFGCVEHLVAFLQRDQPAWTKSAVYRCSSGAVTAPLLRLLGGRVVRRVASGTDPA